MFETCLSLNLRAPDKISNPTCSDFKDNLKYCLNIEGITGSCSEIVIDKSFSEIAEGKWNYLFMKLIIKMLVMATRNDVGVQFDYLIPSIGKTYSIFHIIDSIIYRLFK